MFHKQLSPAWIKWHIFESGSIQRFPAVFCYYHFDKYFRNDTQGNIFIKSKDNTDAKSGVTKILTTPPSLVLLNKKYYYSIPFHYIPYSIIINDDYPSGQNAHKLTHLLTSRFYHRYQGLIFSLPSVTYPSLVITKRSWEKVKDKNTGYWFQMIGAIVAPVLFIRFSEVLTILLSKNVAIWFSNVAQAKFNFILEEIRNLIIILKYNRELK